MRRISVSLTAFVFSFVIVIAGLPQETSADYVKKLEGLTIIPVAPSAKGGAVPQVRTSGNVPFTAGIASDVASVLAGIVINRVESAAYAEIGRAASAGLASVEGIALPGGTSLELPETKAYIDSPGIKSIIADPKPFLRVFLKELAGGVAESCMAPDKADSPERKAWKLQLVAWVKATIGLEGEVSLDVKSEAAFVEGIIRAALGDLITQEATTGTPSQQGFAIAAKAFLDWDSTNLSDDQLVAFTAYLYGLLSNASPSLAPAIRDASLSFGQSIFGAFAYFRSDHTNADFPKFLAIVTRFGFDLSTCFVDAKYGPLLGLGEDTSLALIQGDFELAAATVAKVPAVMGAFVPSPAAKRGISVVASAVQYGFYYKAQAASDSDAQRLLLLRTQVLEDFITNNTDRSNRAGSTVISLEGDLGLRWNVLDDGGLNPGFSNLYSLCFGLAGDWYWGKTYGLKAQINALDLGSYLAFENGSFALDNSFNIADALFPSATVGFFWDFGVLLNVGVSFGSLPRFGSDKQHWTTSLRIGASVPIFDFN